MTAFTSVAQALRPTFVPARGILARYILLRLLLCTALFSIALISVVDRPWTLLTTQILFYLAAIAYFFMGTSAFLLPAFGTRGWFVWAQLVFDTAMVTALVYLTGSTSSPFFVLYFMNLLAAAWMLPQVGVLIVTLIDALAFSSLIGARLVMRQEVGTRDASEVVIELLSIVLVGALASVLSGRITSAKNELIENAELTQRLIDDHDQILNQVPAGIVTVDAMGAIDSVNPAAFEILGPVLGQQIAEVLPGQGRRWEHVHARGTQRRFLLCNQTTRRQGGYVVAIEDVTRMRQIEAELAREERLAAVGRLAAGLAHEIRNPLASLSGAVQLLGEKSEAPLFDIVLREVHRINDLVEEFLDTARPLKLSIAQVDVQSLVNGVVGAFRNDPRYRDRVAIHVDCEGSTEPVGADASRLSQVLWNLLLNAAQSSPGPCRVDVTAATVDRFLELDVKDDGPGIPPASQERIFDPFYTTRSGGTGLGLANVHRIVRAHGGTVEVESEVGHGARFILRFPLAPEQDFHEITDVKVEVRPNAR